MKWTRNKEIKIMRENLRGIKHKQIHTCGFSPKENQDKRTEQILKIQLKKAFLKIRWGINLHIKIFPWTRENRSRKFYLNTYPEVIRIEKEHSGGAGKNPKSLRVRSGAGQASDCEPVPEDSGAICVRQSGKERMS